MKKDNQDSAVNDLSNAKNSVTKCLVKKMVTDKSKPTDSRLFSIFCLKKADLSHQSSTVRRLMQKSWTVCRSLAEVVRFDRLQCDSQNDQSFSAMTSKRSAEIMSKILAEHSSVEQVKDFIRNEKPWDRVKRTFMNE